MSPENPPEKTQTLIYLKKKKTLLLTDALNEGTKGKSKGPLIY